jgi:hypothetical protein
VLSCLVTQCVVVPFAWDVKPPSLDICGDVDCSGTSSVDTGSLQAWLSGARACPEPGFEFGL